MESGGVVTESERVWHGGGQPTSGGHPPETDSYFYIILTHLFNVGVQKHEQRRHALMKKYLLVILQSASGCFRCTVQIQRQIVLRKKKKKSLSYSR